MIQRAPDSPIGAVILGAGSARRFGADKRLHPLGTSTVALTTCATYCQVFASVRVVLKPGDDELAQMLQPLQPEIVYAEDAHLGMGHSLAAGFADLPWQWAFVALLDMPYIRSQTLQTMQQHVSASTTARIFAPVLSASAAQQVATAKLNAEQRIGHPIAWHGDYFAEIRQCQGDQGARFLLQKYQRQIVRIEVDDPGIHQDIDAPGDLL